MFSGAVGETTKPVGILTDVMFKDFAPLLEMTYWRLTGLADIPKSMLALSSREDKRDASDERIEN